MVGGAKCVEGRGGGGGHCNYIKRFVAFAFECVDLVSVSDTLPNAGLIVVIAYHLASPSVGVNPAYSSSANDVTAESRRK